MERTCELERKTAETHITLQLNLDKSGASAIDTGIPFFDHMLAQVARHGELTINLWARGDLQVDFHHTVEDVGIVLGQGFKRALGECRGIDRFAQAYVPMDDALCRVVVDISGRPFLYADLPFSMQKVGSFPTELCLAFLRAFVQHSGITLHAEILHGQNTHHQMESLMKALGRSLKMATRCNGTDCIPSTKGVL